MSDEAVEAARRLLSAGPGENLSRVDISRVCRALLSREAALLSALTSIVERHKRYIELSPGVGAERQEYGLAVCNDILSDLRALKGQPSADGGKCEHDYEAHDDKGWECKKCGHQT